MLSRKWRQRREDRAWAEAVARTEISLAEADSLDSNAVRQRGAEAGREAWPWAEAAARTEGDEVSLAELERRKGEMGSMVQLERRRHRSGAVAVNQREHRVESLSLARTVQHEAPNQLHIPKMLQWKIQISLPAAASQVHHSCATSLVHDAPSPLSWPSASPAAAPSPRPAVVVLLLLAVAEPRCPQLSSSQALPRAPAAPPPPAVGACISPIIKCV